MPVPVDTWRSWVILGSCFYINFIILGMSRLSGIFFVETVAKFNVGRTAASFPYTFASFVECLCGPLTGYLAHKFGIYKILIIGSLFCTVGLGACSFVENIGLLSLCYGLIYGLGASTILLIPVLVNIHFYKHRAVASGLRSSASPVGSFILPPVTEILLGKYDLSGTFLILTGLIFNCLPATLLMRAMSLDFKSKKKSNSFIWRDAEKQPLLQDDKTRKVYSDNTSKQNNLPNQKEVNHLKPELNGQFPEAVCISNDSKITEISFVSKERLEKGQTVCSERDKYNKGNFYSREKDAKITKDIPKHVLKSNKSIDPQNKNSNKTQKGPFFTVMTDPVLICLVLQTVFYIFIHKSFLTVIVDFASDIGLTDQEQAFTLVLYSAGEIAGPLCLSWLVDKSYFKKTFFVAFTLFLQALLVVVISFSNGSIMLLSLLGAMGFVNSAQVFIVPLMIPDYIPEENQTIAMPSIPFLSAPGALLVSPLIGFVREGLGSYVYMFYILGVMSAASGLIFLTIECLSKRRKF